MEAAVLIDKVLLAREAMAIVGMETRRSGWGSTPFYKAGEAGRWLDKGREVAGGGGK
jgi:hypothetical protein